MQHHSESHEIFALALEKLECGAKDIQQANDEIAKIVERTAFSYESVAVSLHYAVATGMNLEQAVYHFKKENNINS